MMENFQIKHREKMVKGYITAETKSNALYALFFYFFGKLFNAIKRLLVLQRIFEQLHYISICFNFYYVHLQLAHLYWAHFQVGCATINIS